jgi:diguanylate cyclase (GGDEF)-like protein
VAARYVMAGYWAGAVAIIAAVLALPVSDVLWGTVGWSALAVLAVGAILLGLRMHHPRRRWPWLLLAGGIVVSSAGDALYIQVQAGAPETLLGVSNVFYLVMFMAIASAQLRFARSGSSGVEQAGLADAITVILVLLLLVYLTVVSPAMPDFMVITDPSVLAYILGSGLLLATVVRLLTTRRRNPSVLFLVAAALLALFADILFGLQSTGGSLRESPVTDVGWLLMYVCWGAAALHPSMARLTEPEVLPNREITLRTGAVLVVTALIGPVALMVEALSGHVRDGVVLALASTMLFLLSLTRMAAAANTHRRWLIYREHHDTLTGLANRVYFTERVAEVQRRPEPVAVLLIDLDDFKVVNDVLGHSVGDEVLVTIARRISRLLGRHDLGARLGGDEFAVLASCEPSAAALAAWGQRVCAAIAEPIAFAGREIRVTGCVGVAGSPSSHFAEPTPPEPAEASADAEPDETGGDATRGGEARGDARGGDARGDARGGTRPDRSTPDSAVAPAGAKLESALALAELPVVGIGGEPDPLADDLLRQAGLALQAARASGMGQWCLYRSDVHDAMVERMHLRAALDRAVTEGSFELYFQPIVALEPESTVGFEALVRWDHPTLGLVAPSDFIDLAEETGQIEAIGAWVMRGAISTAAHWYHTQPATARPYISVNVSARQFRTPGFAQRVDRELAAAGLPASHLMVELTESVLLREEDQVWTELATLRDTGVRLALDDFGTGFSSLSYLVQTPIDVIKIDKSFVRTLGTSHRHYAIINGIVRLAQQLGLQVVAEGIETTGDLEFLIRMGCRYGQGYLFAPPMTRKEADAWLNNGGSGTDGEVKH